MSLRNRILGPQPPEPTPAKVTVMQEIAHRTMDLVCQLSEEAKRKNPDRDRIGDILDELDVLAADYRREQARK